MPRKVRDLRADLRADGYVLLKTRGKGSHERWKHPFVAEVLTLAGKDGDDAQPYQERDVRQALWRAREAKKRGIS
jgi:predicted RNA binding protein YcfA (HicA-like mRNA interferase family)